MEAGREEQHIFINNSEQTNMLGVLLESLDNCTEFYFTVAFMTFGGIQLLLQKFKELESKGVSGKILTSTYQNFSEPKAINKLREFNNLEVRVFNSNVDGGFHAKGYIFTDESIVEVYIGSSNLTTSALKENIEWNVKVLKPVDSQFVIDVMNDYKIMWEKAGVLTDEFMHKYEQAYIKYKSFDGNIYITEEESRYQVIQPNTMQCEAMDRLRFLRKHGASKSLVIAATGTGKTYMSAFDVKQVVPKRMLFIVHQEQILKSAQETFEKVMSGFNIKMGFFTGNQKEVNSDYLFATIQTMSRYFEDFAPDSFDYIIIDEAHHVGGQTYQRVMDYFKPKFLLGMTATPERCDDFDIFKCFDGHVALEVRLRDALEEKLVIPFHYFGIKDIEGIDLSDVKLNQTSEIAKRLKVNERVDFIIEQMYLFGHDGIHRKVLGFCVNVEHAEFMAERFNEAGIVSACLTGADRPNERDEIIKRLESDEDPLEIIFTVDIFNEGVDIPAINLVLMLRPTNSPIIFIQQLGRGLRKQADKEFLTVLDFIGNHNKSFLTAIALNGDHFYDKDSLKVAVATGFPDIPGDTFIMLDHVSKEQILKQLDKENFNSMTYLKETYEEFRRMLKGRTPYMLTDYLKYEGAPDPVKFLVKEPSYLHFISKVEKDKGLEIILSDDTISKTLKEWSKQLPLRRPYEFIIIDYFMKHIEANYIDLYQATKVILDHVESVDERSVLHSMECLGQCYYDNTDVKLYEKLFELKGDVLIVLPTFNQIRKVPHFQMYLQDIIDYGLIRYEKEFGYHDYGVPHFKLYETYTMRDVARLSNYDKKHSAFRGSGLLVNGQDYFLFVDLHKEEDIKESINYQDKFISKVQFQWESPNATQSTSERGLNIVKNKERGINLHLFIRKYKTIDGKVEPYIYIGKGNTISYEGEKPIRAQLELENEVPTSLYREFIKKV